jgi:hypothetical protein
MEIELLITPIIGAVVGAITALIVERYRNRIQALSRYHEFQFNLYRALWDSLYDLKLAADDLWEMADAQNLRKFAEQLQKTEDTINRNILLIEEGHLQELKRVISAFWEFRIGKEKLIGLWRKREHYGNIDEWMIRQMIKDNMRIREQYNCLIEEVSRSLRRQLRAP